MSDLRHIRGPLAELIDDLAKTAFLETLFANLSGIIDFRAIREGATRRIECFTIAETLKVIADHHAWNCYVGVATRKLGQAEFDEVEARREPTRRERRKAGGKFNLAELRAFWVDVDLDDDDPIGHKHEMDIRLEDLPVQPSMIVWSGAGLHVYWLLEEPLDVSTQMSVAGVEATLKGLCDVLGADRAATDASRILRVPGTLNIPDARKRAKGRVTVECVFHQTDTGTRIA